MPRTTTTKRTPTPRQQLRPMIAAFRRLSAEQAQATIDGKTAGAQARDRKLRKMMTEIRDVAASQELADWAFAQLTK